jgi:hypothetical protein
MIATAPVPGEVMSLAANGRPNTTRAPMTSK